MDKNAESTLQPCNKINIVKTLPKKEECKKLKFKTNHTSHNFRDTFISQAVQGGVNFKSILQWVGQSSYTIMDRYIHLSPEFNKRKCGSYTSNRESVNPLFTRRVFNNLVIGQLYIPL